MIMLWPVFRALCTCIGRVGHRLPSQESILSTLLRTSLGFGRAARILALALVLLCSVLAPAARAAFMIPGAPIRPKDFTLTKKDGYYHLFYIRNNTAGGPAGTEVDFGHAVSNDLYHWTQMPPVMHVDSLGWDNKNVWAPHIVYRDGLYWMFYTGVEYVPGQYNYTQRMGCAVSTDLYEWSRVPGPNFDTAGVPWAWWNPLNPNPACRDPFVIPDPNRPGMWLMYYTASIQGDSTTTEIGIAESDGDFQVWTDLKPLTVTSHNVSFNTLTESPHLFEHNGLWYLFITTNSGQPLSFYTTTNPTGDQAAWTYRSRLRNMLGYDTSSWFASEHFKDGVRDLFAFIQGDRVEIREILWGSSWTFGLVQPPLFHVVQMHWATPEIRRGEQTSLEIIAANPYNGIPSLETFVIDSLGVETSVPPESLGIYAHPQLFQDTTRYVWYAQRYPSVPDTDTVSVTRLRIRTTDRTAQSDVLTIRAPLMAPPDTSVAVVDTTQHEEPTMPELDDRLWRASSMRPLSGTPLGSGPAIALTLAKAVDARIDLYDVLGRRVRNLANRRLPQGITILPWDGRGDDGALQPRGIYFVRLTAGARTLTTRMFYTRH